MNRLPKIWSIGCGKNNCDLSISWFEPPPNLYEPDIIIMNLESLEEKALEHIDEEQFNNMINKIFNKFITKGTLIYIISDEKYLEEDVKEYKNTEKKPFYNPTLIYKIPSATYSNYDVSPLNFKIEKVEGKKVHYDSNEPFSPYFAKINQFDSLLRDFSLSNHFQNVISANEISGVIVDSLRSSVTPHEDQTELIREIIATDNTQNPIAVRCWLEIAGYWKSGEAVYLPKPKSVSLDEFVETILQIYGIRDVAETIPDWAYQIEFPQVEDLQKKIDISQTQLDKIGAEINNLKTKKTNIENYYNLLSSTGTNLEDIVYDAFKELGFQEIRRIRSKEKEDWIFEFKTVSDYTFAVLEVKGVDDRIKRAHLRQTSEWVSDYFNEGQNVKGIFVPNQFRSNPYPLSKGERSDFEHNEVIYARDHNICILPSSVLFEIVKRHLGGEKISRKDIEQSIVSTRGVLNDIT